MFTHFISLGAVVNHIPKAVLANYRRRRISVSLQRGVANAINTRTNRLTARTRGIQGRIPDCLWRGGGLLVVWHNECQGEGRMVILVSAEDERLRGLEVDGLVRSWLFFRSILSHVTFVIQCLLFKILHSFTCHLCKMGQFSSESKPPCSCKFSCLG